MLARGMAPSHRSCLRPPASAAPSAAAPLPVILRDYKPVTAERLLKPEPGNWLQIRRQYSGWRYSELDQIAPANVKQLQLVWVFATGAGNAHEAAPLLNNGVMYVLAPAKSGSGAERQDRPSALAKGCNLERERELK